MAAALLPPPTEPPDLDPDLVQRGGRLFLDPRISGDGTQSCAGCHAADPDRRQLYRDGQLVPPGTEGARIAPKLRGLYQTAPYLWDGSLASLSAVIDRMLASEMRGGTLSPVDKRALEAYLLSIPAFDNGRIEPDGTPVEPATKSMRDGFALFTRAECNVCHPPPAFTRRLRFDIGTGGRFDVPTLRGLPAEGPLGHDGRWANLEEALDAILKAREVELTFREKRSLLEYLKLL